MFDKEKVRIMTHLAVYDKEKGKHDRKITEYFRGDYIFRKNCNIVIGVLIGIAVILGFYFINIVFIKEFDLIGFDYMGKLKLLGIIVLILIVVYSIIGRLIGLKEYKMAEKRIKNYFSLLKYLEKYDNKD